MAKKKSPPKKVEKKPEPEIEKNGGSSGLIKILIIAGTFFAIAALSIVTKGLDNNWPSVITKGLDNNWPSVNVVAIRIVLLSLCTVVYFLMLYRTRASRQNEGPKPQTGKK